MFSKENKDKIDKYTILLLILRACGSICAFATTLAIMRAAQRADLSPSVAMSFTALTMFVVSIIFYFLYKERLTCKLVIGMLLVLIAIALVAISKTLNYNGSGELNLFAVFTPILLALL